MNIRIEKNTVRDIAAGALLTCLLLLSGCSSDDNESSTNGTPQAGADQPLPGIAVGEPNPSTPGTDTGVETPVLADDPSGDDTSPIAGFWDSTRGVAGVDEDISFALISSDGLFTVYDYRQDDIVSEGNCYNAVPLRLSVANAATHTYERADFTTLVAVANSDRSVMTVQLGDEPANDWEATTSMMPTDLPLCKF